MKIPLLSAVVLGALLLTGCSASAPASDASTSSASASATTNIAADEPCDGVRVVVDYGILDAPTTTNCVEASGEMLASEAVNAAGIITDGNAAYGDAVVCRVDGRPGIDETVEVEGEAPFVEPCDAMSPAYAFWALWVKPGVDDKWGFAMEGLATLKVKPGQTIGFAYTTGTATEPKPPAES